MAKEMKQLSETSIYLDKEKILESISSSGEYKTENAKIKKWSASGEHSDSFLINANIKGISFMGCLNKVFDMDGYGIHKYPNGDKYFGFYRNDKRNFNGIYYWPSEEKDGRIKQEMYYGFWKDNLKEKNGMYVWLDESTQEKNKNFDNTNLEAYIGDFTGGSYNRGTYLQKAGDDYYLYHGKFTKDGKKNDENGFFYSAKFDRLFHGKIENDTFVKGYVTYFNPDEGTIENIVYVNFDKNLNVTNIILDKDLQQKEKENESKLCSRFRDVILGIDYFGELYKKIKDITKFMDENMNDIDIFNNEEKYPIMINLCVAYSRNNIDTDIKSKVFENAF